MFTAVDERTGMLSGIDARRHQEKLYVKTTANKTIKKTQEQFRKNEKISNFNIYRERELNKNKFNL